MKTERELFEAWAYSKKWNIFRVRDMGIDHYVDDFVDGAWSGWQASANREGYKRVPVEINNEIESAMFSSVARGEMPCDIYKAMIGAQESKG